MPEVPTLKRGPRAILACLLALVAWFAVDALLFRTGLYTDWVEPDSSTGQFEFTLRREQEFRQSYSGAIVLTIGNSRFAYLPRQANELTGRSGYVFRSAGVAGSDPRSWYYMLRDLDPSTRRYRAIVLGLDHFYDEERADKPDDDLRALHYTIVRLRLPDAIPFALSFHGWPYRWDALRGSIFKGFVLQRDIQEFLNSPRKRIDTVTLNRRGFEEWTYNFIEEDRNMAGLSIDWTTMTATYPPGAGPLQRESIKNELLAPVAVQSGRLAAFRRLWLGKIAERYRESPTKLIFVTLPRGPIPRPESMARKQSCVVCQLATAYPNIKLADEHAFESLDHPELYKDGVHLNREGATRFAPMLVAEVCRVLGTHLLTTQ